MNLVGKIFVVLIFVLSLVLMTLTMMVYVTHTNWRLVVDNPSPKGGESIGLKQQVDALKQENERLKNEYTKIEDLIEKERDSKRKDVLKLANELVRQTEDLAKAQKEVDDLRETQVKNVTQANMAQSQANKLTKDSDDLRKQIASLHSELDRERKTHEVLRDEANSVNRRVLDLEKRSAALSGELGRAVAVLNYLNIPPNLEVITAKEPPRGLVAWVVEVNNDRKLVEISVGSDSGVREGHLWEVRDAAGANYIGRIQVIKTDPHRSVCAVQTDMTNGVIAKGNKVIPVQTGLGK